MSKESRPYHSGPLGLGDDTENLGIDFGEVERVMALLGVDGEAEMLGSQGPHAQAPLPLRNLARAMVKEAYLDMVFYARGSTKLASAIEWVRTVDGDDENYPFTFDNCCKLIGFDARRVRKGLLYVVRRPRRRTNRGSHRKPRSNKAADRAPEGDGWD